MITSLTQRPRRNRKSSSIRALVQENQLRAQDFIAPFFITEGKNVRAPINALPGQHHLSLDCLEKEIDMLLSLKITSVIFFPLVRPEHKDALGSYGYSEKNHLLHCIQKVKETYPQLSIFVDVALDPFTTHGHDGLLSKGEILNDETLECLSKMSLLYAQAGADVIAPSDMMDGRIGYMRNSLDQHGFCNVSLMSYSAKYASSLYGPFREALKSTPSQGDKLSYQMNPANQKEAILEAKLDEDEGADILMIKPATLYLDVISKVKEKSLLPIAAYHVSGEYSMLKAGAEKGWLDFEKALLESLMSIKRAGADIIVSYGAKEAAELLAFNR